MEDVVSLHFIAYSRFPRIFHHFFGLLSNDAITRAQQHLNLGHFFFLAHCHRAFHFPTSKLAFSGGFPKEENAREINHTFTAPFMSRHKRLLKNGCSLREKNIFLGNKKFRFSRKVRILTFPCNIIMYYNGKWKI